MSITRFRTTRLALLTSFGGAILLLTGATSAPHPERFKGGPWISVESPVNPYDSAARGAAFLVHTFHHSVPTTMEIEARAEGIVDGNRRTVPIPLSAARVGTYPVRNVWGTKGTWSVLVVATQPSPRGSIHAVVDLGADGSVSRVTLPQRMMTTVEIDRSLRERVAAPVSVGAR